MPFSSCGVHPIFKQTVKVLENEKENILDKMRQYRPAGVGNFLLVLRNESIIFFTF